MPRLSERFEVRCSPAELEAWRTVAGLVPLGRWLRHVANQAAGGEVATYTPIARAGDSQTLAEAVDVVHPSKFRPDPRRK